MLFRFSLYGFLKNQQYYEPFLILAFREKGLSFFMIGVLFAYREILVNAMEIPSGAMADLYGRRRCMILSMAAYVASFAIFGYSQAVWQLFVAMGLFSVGEAFRTGTHKAIIIDWLDRQGRRKEKTQFYGSTRAWAKVGSAVAVVISAGMVFYTGQYSIIFYMTMVPYVFGIINFLGYPKYLDGDQETTFSISQLFLHLWNTLKVSVRDADLRQLMFETVSFDGIYATIKDYIQPVLKQAAIALPVLVSLETERRSALLVGAVYFVLHLLSSAASFRAHRVVTAFGDEEKGARYLWSIALLFYAFLCVGVWLGWHPLIILGFVLLAVIQNLWRPIQIGRLGDRSESRNTATVLSIESQFKSASVAVLAPLLGYLVDAMGRAGGTWDDIRFMPVGVVGVLAAGAILLFTRPLPDRGETSSEGQSVAGTTSA